MAYVNSLYNETFLRKSSNLMRVSRKVCVTLDQYKVYQSCNFYNIPNIINVHPVVWLGNNQLTKTEELLS